MSKGGNSHEKFEATKRKNEAKEKQSDPRGLRQDLGGRLAESVVVLPPKIMELKNNLDFGGRSTEIPHILEDIDGAKKLLASLKHPKTRKSAASLILKNSIGTLKNENPKTIKSLTILSVRDAGGKIFYVDEKDEALVKRTVKNGINSQYLINKDEGNIVICYHDGKGRTYVPYSPGLDTPAIRKRGIEYLMKTIEQARQKIIKDKIPSRAVKGKILTEVISADIIAQLMIVEHVDPNKYTNDEDDQSKLKNLYNSVFVITGGNKELAYSNSGSSAGAFGFAQFMPGTYKDIQEKYKLANLIENFRDGMKNHVNAVVAMYCLMDSNLAAAPEERRDKYTKNADSMALYLASCYNGGAGRTNKKVEAFGEKWREHLPGETRIYLDKLDTFDDFENPESDEDQGPTMCRREVEDEISGPLARPSPSKGPKPAPLNFPFTLNNIEKKSREPSFSRVFSDSCKRNPVEALDLLGLLHKKNSKLYFRLKNEVEQTIEKNMQFTMRNRRCGGAKEKFIKMTTTDAKHLYTFLTFGDQEIFNSMFKELFKNFLGKLRKTKTSGYKFLETVDFVRFRDFLRITSAHNQLDEFLQTMNETEQHKLIQKVLIGLPGERDPRTETVTAVEVLINVKNSKLLNYAKSLVEKELKNSKSSKAIKTYKFIESLIAEKNVGTEKWLVRKAEDFKAEFLLKVSKRKLFDKKGLSVERQYIYPDKDGRSTYQEFIASYRRAKGWKMEYSKGFVLLKSPLRHGRQIHIYINKPGRSDILTAYMKHHGLKPETVVHRGHAHWMRETIASMDKNTAVVISSACGGYSRTNDVSKKVPGAPYFSTRGEGTMHVTNPLMENYHDMLLNTGYVDWVKLWSGFNKHTDRRAVDYTPPYENLTQVIGLGYNLKVEK